MVGVPHTEMTANESAAEWQKVPAAKFFEAGEIGLNAHLAVTYVKMANYFNGDSS